MATPPPTESPPATATAMPAKRKKPSTPQAPIIPWSHEETAQLIEAYQEKWYSLRRGPLKSGHWEEVAVTVAARCGRDDDAESTRPAKSALQCRHKMEKLRQRFRSESRRVGPTATPAAASAWPFFVPMDRMLRGPFPISACPMEPPAGETTEDDDSDGDEDRERVHAGNDDVLRRRAEANRLAPPAKRPRRGGGERPERRNVAAKLAAEIRGFSERMAAAERLKMEVARDIERSRMEMEGKRIEMILRSQNKIVDAIARAFGSPNRHLSVAKKET